MSLLSKKICTWGSVLFLSLVVIVATSETYSTVQLLKVPGMEAIEIGSLLTLYPGIIITIYCFFGSMNGPGFISPGWSPKCVEDKKHLQYCTVCQGYKAPRSHHCRTCGRCVLKMDHHCGVLATCVGHQNHMKFVLLLVFGLAGFLQCIFLNSCFLSKLVNKVFLTYERVLPISVYTRLLVISGIAASTGAGFGLSVLLFYQMRGLLTNKTYIEELICAKAEDRRKKNKDMKPFIYPYNLGWQRNLIQIMRWNLVPSGDGYDWPVKQGCNKHSLTIEQREQKKKKQDTAKWLECEKNE